MLSKEEIEKSKECLKETIQNTYAEGKAIKLNNLLEYIDKLESDKQKLIEKLEERKKEYEEKSGGNTYHIQSIINAEIRELDWVLSILKGENDEH